MARATMAKVRVHNTFTGQVTDRFMQVGDVLYIPNDVQEDPRDGVLKGTKLPFKIEVVEFLAPVE